MINALVSRSAALWFVPFLVVNLYGCGKPGGPGTAGEALSGQANFASLSKTTLGPRCLACHSDVSPAAGVSYSSYASTMKTGSVTPFSPEKSALYTVTVSGFMPKGGTPLSAAETSAISDWIRAGASNADDAPEAPAPTPPERPDPVASASPSSPAPPPVPGPAPTPTPTPAPTSTGTYTWIRTNILQPKCAACHSGAGASAGVDLSSYSGAKARANAMLTAISGGTMPPSGKLDGASIQAVSTWINAGTPNN